MRPRWWPVWPWRPARPVRAGAGGSGARARARQQGRGWQRRRHRRARAQGRGRRRAVQEDGDPRRHAHRRHRRSAAQPDGHRHRGQPDHLRCARPAGPGCRSRPNREPRDADHEIDGKGMYVMPGFVDMHVHGATSDKAPDLSYAYKLWLAHGVTTVRGVSLSSAAVSQLREGTLGEERDRRAAHLQLPDARLRLAERPGDLAREGARVGALGRRQQHRRHQVLQSR